MDLFSVELKVRDYELDMQGIVNNSVYQNYFEHCRHEYLLSLGIDFAELTRQKVHLVVARIEIDYKSPLASRDQFIITIEPTKVTRARIVFTQRIIKKIDNSLCCEGVITGTAINNETGRLGIPRELIEKFPT